MTALFAGTAQATTFGYVSQIRSVSSFSFLDGSGGTQTATDFLPFVASSSSNGSSASQNSTLGTTEILLRVEASGYDAASASSGFDVRFTIAQAVPFTLTGFLYRSVGGASMRLEEVGDAVIYEPGTIPSGGLAVDESGVLGPGTYDFTASASAGGFTFDQSVGGLLTIPEPGTATLLALGLAGVAWRRPRVGGRKAGN